MNNLNFVTSLSQLETINPSIKKTCFNNVKTQDSFIKSNSIENVSEEISQKNSSADKVNQTNTVSNSNFQRMSIYFKEKVKTVCYANKAKEDNNDAGVVKYYQVLEKGVRPELSYAATNLSEKKFSKFNELIDKKVEPNKAYNDVLEIEDDEIKIKPKRDEENGLFSKSSEYKFNIMRKFKIQNQALENFDVKHFIRFNMELDKKVEPAVAYSAAELDEEHYRKYSFLCKNGVDSGIAQHAVGFLDVDTPKLNTMAKLSRLSNLLYYKLGRTDVNDPQYRDICDMILQFSSTTGGYLGVLSMNDEELTEFNKNMSNAFRFCSSEPSKNLSNKSASE